MLDTEHRLIARRGKRRTSQPEEVNLARRRYQEGCLYKRGKRRKVWAARWREDVLAPDGTLRRTMRYETLGLVSEIPTQREARNLLQSRLRPLNERRYQPESTMRLAAFVAERFQTGMLPTLKFATQQIYSHLLKKHLLPRFGEERLCDLNRVAIQHFLLEKLKQGYAWETVNHLRNLLSKVLGTAIAWGYLQENAARGVKMPERTLKRQHNWLAPHEVRRLLDSLCEPSRTIVLLAVLTGLRVGEILALRWGRVNFAAGTIRVEETVYEGHFGTPKTRASRREIPLAPVVLQALELHQSRAHARSPDALVFSTSKGTAFSARNLRKRHLVPACRLARLTPIGWHALRHTHATLLHGEGVPLRVAQAQLGHAHMSTTLEIYTHATDGAQREAVAKLERIVFSNVHKLQAGASTKWLN